MAKRKDSIDMMISGSGLSRQVAKRVVHEFKGSRLADVWTVLRDPLPVVDMLVIDQIRFADSANSPITFTPSEIMAFRRMLVEELAAKGWTL